MALFYHPLAQPNANLEIDAQEGAHISRVLRMKDGDLIWLTDGKGLRITASIEHGKRSLTAHVSEAGEMMPQESRLTLAIAPTKNNERLEWFVEKAVEIGIQKIQLIHCRHSERPSIKTERLQRVAVSAMKQSQRYYLPEILPIIAFNDWLASIETDQKFIAHCRTERHRRLLRDALQNGIPACIAIGPEGDFSDEEIETARTGGFVEVSLGHARLRTETAALAAVHTFELINQITHV
jgi:16S rRNA (uracil1498-N3)-methyltransferase